MLRLAAVFISYSYIVAACCNYATRTYTNLSDVYIYKNKTRTYFAVEPSVVVGPVLQFWTNTGLRCVGFANIR